MKTTQFKITACFLEISVALIKVVKVFVVKELFCDKSDVQ